MSYDQKCQELAEHFLADSPRYPGDAESLAQDIQEAIEKWLENRSTTGRRA